MTPRPGEIYWAYTGGAERRPVVVVSREDLNRGDYLVGVLLTSAKLEVRWDLPNCMPFRVGQFGLTKNCAAQGESVTQLEKSDLDLEEGPIGVLNAEAMRGLIHAIGYAIAAECEPM